MTIAQYSDYFVVEFGGLDFLPLFHFAHGEVASGPASPVTQFDRDLEGSR